MGWVVSASAFPAGSQNFAAPEEEGGRDTTGSGNGRPLLAFFFLFLICRTLYSLDLDLFI